MNEKIYVVNCYIYFVYILLYLFYFRHLFTTLPLFQLIEVADAEYHNIFWYRGLLFELFRTLLLKN